MDAVLGSALKLFLSFLVSGAVLCFGFSLRTMLITHGWFSCCSVALILIKDFSASCSAVSEDRVRSLEGSGGGQYHSGLPGLTPSDIHNTFVEVALVQEHHVAQDGVEEE